MDLDSALTLRLTEQALGLCADGVPVRATQLAKQCLLDWLAVTLAGSHAALVAILEADLPRGEGGVATVLGYRGQRALYDAALLNGTSSHALDYDDVNYALMGHPTVPVMPALLALAEREGASGAELIEAFIAGYEFECRVGLAMAPGLYGQGFHATATVGALGAALACARLLRLDAITAAHAIGIAVTQAAGLKSMFGTDCKALQAGNAARIGLQSACLAARGFKSRTDSLECAQGFAATHTDTFKAEAALMTPPDGLYLYANLFKYHASCYETHATIESCRKLREHPDFELSEIVEVRVEANSYCDNICNIQTPRSGLEAKFSLRQTAAFALLGLDTGNPTLFGEEVVSGAEIQACRERVTIALSEAIPALHAVVTVTLKSGAVLRATHDASQPASDLDAQALRLQHKFRSLVEPLAGREVATRIIEQVDTLERSPNLAGLLSAITF